MHTTCYLYLKIITLQINTLNYCWHTGDLRVGIEEIDVLQSKHLQDLFSDANTESAFYVFMLFLPTNVCKILE